MALNNLAKLIIRTCGKATLGLLAMERRRSLMFSDSVGA